MARGPSGARDAGGAAMMPGLALGLVAGVVALGLAGWGAGLLGGLRAVVRRLNNLQTGALIERQRVND